MDIDTKTRGWSRTARMLAAAATLSLLYSLSWGMGRGRAQGEELQVVPGTESFVEHDLKDPLPATLAVSFGGQNWDLKALGSGLRKKYLFKVYVAVLYADASADLGADPAPVVTSGDIARRMVLVLKRNIDGAKISEAISEGFIDKVWKKKPEGDLKAKLDEFIAFFGGQLKEGETIELTYLPGIGLLTSVSGQAKPIVTEPRLARDIWGIWLGADPISEDLRDELVLRVTPGSRPE